MCLESSNNLSKRVVTASETPSLPFLGRFAVRFSCVRRFPGWVACCLCVLIPVLVGCGDYCLFCEGQGSGGGDEGQERTAEAGDVILADQMASSIYIYEYPSKTKRSLLTEVDDVSGLALYSAGAENECDNPFSGLQDYQRALNLETIENFTELRDEEDRLSIAVIPKGMSFPYGTDEIDQTTTELLFFTVNTEDTLYVYDLTGTSILSLISNPLPITNSMLGAGFFESPTALAISAVEDTVTIFVLNDKEGDSSVKRLSVNFQTGEIGSPETIATMTESSRRLVDIAYFDQTDALYVTKKALTAQDVFAQGWVYEILNATDRSNSENLNSDSNFIGEPQNFTGLTVAFKNKQETAADLLVSREIAGWVEQYDILDGGDAETAFTFGAPFDFPQAVAFDCTNDRLVMTHVPATKASARRFFQAFPTQ
jgi:hypothetical protein